MKLITMFESAEELIEATKIQPQAVADLPQQRFLPRRSRLVFDNDMKSVSLEAEGFQLSDNITVESIVKALCIDIGFDVHIT